MQPTCVVLDFDFTLAHFKSGYEGFFSILTRRGVPYNNVVAAYEAAPKIDLEVLITKVSELSGVKFRPTEEVRIRAEFDRWLGDSLELYPDTRAAVEELRQSAPVVILTLGYPPYQEKKVAAVNLEYDDLVIVEGKEEKPEALRKILGRYGAPVLFVEDKSGELDQVRDRGLSESEVRTIHILRPDSPYRNQLPQHPHETVEDLKQLTSLFNQNTRD